MDIGFYWLALIGVFVIAALSFYAGKLLYLLAQQHKRKLTNRRQRIENISESIQIIAKAAEQQQCNLSEASIRIFQLLKGLPLEDPPEYAIQYPNLYALYQSVKDLPTHDARKALSRKEREAQDEKREQTESELESAILREMAKLKSFTAC